MRGGEAGCERYERERVVVKANGQSPSGLASLGHRSPSGATRHLPRIGGVCPERGGFLRRCRAGKMGDCRGGIYAARGFTEAIAFRLAAR